MVTLELFRISTSFAIVPPHPYPTTHPPLHIQTKITSTINNPQLRCVVFGVMGVLDICWICWIWWVLMLVGECYIHFDEAKSQTSEIGSPHQNQEYILWPTVGNGAICIVNNLIQSLMERICEFISMKMLMNWNYNEGWRMQLVNIIFGSIFIVIVVLGGQQICSSLACILHIA